MQVLPDQFIRSLIPCDHKTGAWLSNGRFEKLLCSPVRATSLSTDCCTFIFGFFVGMRAVVSRNDTREPAMTERCTAVGAPPSFPAGRKLWIDCVGGAGGCGGGAGGRNHLPLSPGWVQGPEVLVVHPDAAVDIRQSVHTQTHTRTRSHTMGTRVTWMFWQIDNSKVVIPKLT